MSFSAAALKVSRIMVALALTSIRTLLPSTFHLPSSTRVAAVAWPPVFRAWATASRMESMSPESPEEAAVGGAGGGTGAGVGAGVIGGTI